MILPLPVLYGKYCNKGWSGGNIILLKSVGNEGMEWGAQTRYFWANNSTFLCKGLEQKESLVKAHLHYALPPRYQVYRRVTKLDYSWPSRMSDGDEAPALVAGLLELQPSLR